MKDDTTAGCDGWYALPYYDAKTSALMGWMVVCDGMRIEVADPTSLYPCVGDAIAEAYRRNSGEPPASAYRRVLFENLELRLRLIAALCEANGTPAVGRHGVNIEVERARDELRELRS